MAASGTNIRVLHIDDDSDFGELARDFLERDLEDAEIVLEEDPEKGVERLATENFDCVVCDYQMPALNGLEVLEQVREELDSEIPFIVFTGKGREAVAMEALNLGADRYVQKGGDPQSQFGVLAQAIEQEVGHHRTRREFKRNADMFRDVFDTSGLGLIVFDPDSGTIVDANDVAAELFGRTRPEILNSSPDAVGIPADRSSPLTLEETLERIVSEGPLQEDWRGRRADGEDTWVSAELAPGRIRGETRVIGVLKDITKRKADKEELALFRQLIDHSNALIFVNETEKGELVYANRTARETLGYERDELLGKRVHDIEATFDHEIDWNEHLAEIRRQGQMRYEGEQVRSDGSTIPVEVDLAYVSLESDYVVAIARDIRDRKDRERDIELFRMLIDRATDCIYVVDEETSAFIDVNDSALEMLGYDRETLLSMSVPDISKRFEDTDDYRSYVQYHAGGDPEYDTHIGADGSTHPVEVRGSSVKVGENSYRIVIARDVSSREAREQVLTDLHDAAQDIEAAESEAEVYDRLIEAAESILDFDLVAVDVREGDKLVQKAYSREVGTEGYYSEVSLDEDTFATRAYHRQETILVNDLRDANITPADPDYLSALTVPIDDFGTFQTVSSKVGGFDASDRDLAELLVGHAADTLARLESERQLLAQTRKLQRQNDRLDEFASIVSHDLRNPLNVASGRLELLQEEYSDPNLNRIAEALDRMDSLIQDTLDMARGSRAVTDLDDVTLEEFSDRCWAAIEAPEANLELEEQFKLKADRDRLKQVFENLFRNAVDHGGPDVTVRVGPISDEGFYIEDDGPGIPPDDREVVFERGFTTNEQGTGFGLAIIEEIVEAHDWEVRIDESTEGGARFEFLGVDIVR